MSSKNGPLPSVNGDDGTLNYDVGLTANQIRATGELTLAWREFGAYVRGYGFYDFENQLGDREHRDLSSDALHQVGSGFGERCQPGFVIHGRVLRKAGTRRPGRSASAACHAWAE